jgi:GTPase
MHDNPGRRNLIALANVSGISKNCFTSSLDLKSHPLVHSNLNLKSRYYTALAYVVHECTTDSEYGNTRLAQYKELLARDNTKLSKADTIEDLKKLCADFPGLLARKYLYCLICDIALILVDKPAIDQAFVLLAKAIKRKPLKKISAGYDFLFNREALSRVFSHSACLVAQFRANQNFLAQLEKRFLVVANMSSGKSTLINALVGKPLTQTAQAACTANLCHIYNKPSEDGATHLLSSSLNLDASYRDLMQVEKQNVNYIATFFRTLHEIKARICIIDTPGVNSAIHIEHCALTKAAVKDEKYDKLIYLFNAAYLGTNDEHQLLSFITENVPESKILFVVNKIDTFNTDEDSIEESIEGIRSDLLEIGYTKPVICPLSARFALLLKRAQSGDALSENECEEFVLYSKQFSRPEYDLSHYYDLCEFPQTSESNYAKLAKKSGLEGIENILFGGLNEQ